MVFPQFLDQNYPLYRSLNYQSISLFIFYCETLYLLHWKRSE